MITTSILYLAKEPDDGVIGDLQSLKHYDITICACNPGYVDYYKLLGYNVITYVQLFDGVDVRFDVVIGNPPYQKQKQVGSKSGSANSPLWWEIANRSIELLKDDGILSLITPPNHLCGADKFTDKFLGNDRIVDLKIIDFSANEHFNVGIDVCRWVAKKSVTVDNIVSFTDGRGNRNTDQSIKIFQCPIIDSIMSQLYSFDGPKLKFNKKNCYQYQTVESYLVRNNLPREWAKDLRDSKDDTYCYAVNLNGKIKYSRIEWKNKGVWRVFYPELQSPTIISVDNIMEASGNVFTMTFDIEDEARLTQSYLDTPEYRWIVDQCRLSGRVMNLTNLPNAPIDQVLNADQLSYIQSQL